MRDAQDEDFIGVIRNHRIEVGVRGNASRIARISKAKPFYLVEDPRLAQTLISPKFSGADAPKIAPQRLNLRWVVSILELP